MTVFHRTVDTYRHGVRTLPGRYYTVPELYAAEQERIFSRHWIAVSRADAVAAPGAYLLAEVAGESLIVVRDRAGLLRAFYNVCRHRGTRLCQTEAGRFSGTIQCPYHAWTYQLDGRLIGAPHMGEVEGFDKGDYPLHQAVVAEWEGFVFVNLAPAPEPFAQALGSLGRRFARFHLARQIVVRRRVYQVEANWKLILQNYSECLHCPTIHPELSSRLPYTSGANDLVEGRVLGGSMDIEVPAESATLSGRACARPLGEPEQDGVLRAYYYTIFPTMMLSLHPDYAVFYRVQPRGPVASTVVCEWMVHPQAPDAPGYNIADAEELWDRTNRQDWEICERSQRGIASRVYAPGPYSPRESMPAAWDWAYLEEIGDPDRP